jgi:hypothetical protein
MSLSVSLCKIMLGVALPAFADAGLNPTGKD